MFEVLVKTGLGALVAVLGFIALEIGTPVLPSQEIVPLSPAEIVIPPQDEALPQVTPQFSVPADQVVTPQNLKRLEDQVKSQTEQAARISGKLDLLLKEQAGEPGKPNGRRDQGRER